MGQQLLNLYDEAGKLGLQAKMKLAMLTKIPSSKAGEEADTPELVARFQEAMKTIRSGGA